ncbi:MAG TPA: aldo/keto reductase [Vicinamibacteria bacterium]
MSSEAPRHTNRLIHSTSPYLLQHAHNPVDWYPWGDEALHRARSEDRPILLSIGYSSCHWCHVMERESFEDERVAELMNRNFVCIKVDREERPDLDDVYMAATVAMNHGQGGWPMTVFLTPQQEPFFAGTYFPPTDRYGRPGLTTLLDRIAELWRTDRGSLQERAAEAVRYLRLNAGTAPGAALGEAELRAALEQLDQDFDPRWGGFGNAPKFPPSGSLSLLLRCHHRFGDARALEMAKKTLDAMARGGMYDQVGGGFHRYSVDERWLVPHFEKMLYDNAQLARVYVEGYQVTGDVFYHRVASEVLDYVLREMTGEGGGFFSATDADSEGEEGRFFVWTPEEVQAAVGDEEEARRFCAYYDVTDSGNWEGRSIPNTPQPLSEVAARMALTPEELEGSLAIARAKVYRARLQRVPPALDDKVLAAWNGLMIGALAEGARVLGDPRYLHAAQRAADVILAHLRAPDGRLLRTWRGGRAHTAAYLEDYAYVADALIDLYEAGAPARWLREAAALVSRILEDFADEGGGFFSTARDHEALIVRHREGHDGATPSPNAVAARALARLSFHLDRGEWREAAARAVRAYGKAIARQPRAFTTSLAVVDLLLDGPVELAFAGTPDSADYRALWGEVARRYLPNRIIEHRDPADRESAELPLLAGKEPVDGRAALYVCRDYACRRPITDASAVADALAAARPARGEGRKLEGPRLAGSATAEGTSRYAGRSPFVGTGYGPLGRTGLTVSRIGFGGYRVDDETDEHRSALRAALGGGVNLVDTSTNYMDGGSERLIGQVLSGLAREGGLRRDEVVIVSKIGYVQGSNLEQAQEREQAGRPFPEMVKYADGVWHCIHPEFLADQLPRSLERLQVDALDVCLLHNPEYYLSDAHERSHGTLERRREEFYRRLREAFAFLEGEATAGRIRFYGVSSNTCVRPEHDPEATSLEQMLAAAREAGGEGHRFRVLQLPLNLLEFGPRHRAVLEKAAAEGVGVLVNRPLNAMADDGMIRLASLETEPPPVDLEGQLATVAELESQYRRDIASRLRAAQGSVPPDQLFRWSEELREAAAQVRGLEHWRAMESQRVLPLLLHAVQALDRGLAGGALADAWQAWRNRYLPEVQKLLDELRRRASRETRASLSTITAAVDPLLPPERRGESVSRKALWVLASTPGVSSVLNGMRSPAYVADALGVVAWPPLPDPLRVYEAVAATRPPVPA